MDDTSILERTSGTVHGANLFAYCNNNPIMNVDYTGMYVGATAVGAGISVISVIGYLVIIGIIFIILVWLVNPNLFQFDGMDFSLDEMITKWKIWCTVMAFKLINVTISSLTKDIDSRITNYKYRNGQQEHHIAPRKIFFNKGKPDSIFCSYYLEVSGIDIDSPINKMWLNASFHSALNTNIYYSAVYQLTGVFYDELDKTGVYLALVILRIYLSVFNYMYMLSHGGGI